MIPKKGSRDKIVIYLDRNGYPIEEKEKNYILLNKNDLSDYLKKHNLTFKSPEIANLVLRNEITGNYERLGTGPFTDEAKKMIFAKLLETEKNIKSLFEKNVCLITDSEILEIKKIWSKSTIDINYLDIILRDNNRQPVEMISDAFEITNKKYQSLLREISKKHNLDYEIINKLVVIEKENIGKSDRTAAQNSILTVFNADKDNF